jgi:mono/diheme cytochrome c family protein
VKIAPLLVLAVCTAIHAVAQQRPARVTDSAIAWGKALFHGSANCSACHGEGGRGTAYGPNITGALWLHRPGTYQSLIEQVKHRVPASRRRVPDA